MKKAMAIAICVIVVAMMALALFHLTTEYLSIKEESLSPRTVFGTIAYAAIFIVIVVVVLLDIALVLALAE